MVPYGSVGAHIKTGRSPMAQDHFKTPPDLTLFTPSTPQKKRRAREAEPLGMQGGTGGCRPPTRGSGDWTPPREEQGVWGAAAPQ